MNTKPTPIPTNSAQKPPLDSGPDELQQTKTVLEQTRLETKKLYKLVNISKERVTALEIQLAELTIQGEIKDELIQAQAQKIQQLTSRPQPKVPETKQ